MELFTIENSSFSDIDLAKALEPFNLTGKTVLCYSRLLSFGMLTGREAATRLLDVLQDSVGPTGTVSVPCYSFSGYKNETFDAAKSRSVVGVLGETARSTPGFVRTVHPIYSNACRGAAAAFLSEQLPTTCFGANSFFERFTRAPEPFVLFLGINFSSATLCHHYDQRLNAHGRFLKTFKAKIADGSGSEREIAFDSFVKDYSFYDGSRINCLARFDALATDLGLVKRTRFAGDWIHGINENDFRSLYAACLAVDQLYFLFATMPELEEYYYKNKFSLYHGTLDTEKVLRVKQQLEKGQTL